MISENGNLANGGGGMEENRGFPKLVPKIVSCLGQELSLFCVGQVPSTMRSCIFEILLLGATTIKIIHNKQVKGIKQELSTKKTMKCPK